MVTSSTVVGIIGGKGVPGFKGRFVFPHEWVLVCPPSDWLLLSTGVLVVHLPTLSGLSHKTLPLNSTCRLKSQIFLSTEQSSVVQVRILHLLGKVAGCKHTSLSSLRKPCFNCG
ncbi:hypothetical protein L1987_54601 [Smallanthus sonchifolius]|uniref:Uncharacterized protein n=1 Tax=Smallanthus sonchifolius TaxID=185202 RepID=A0ACB9E7Z1_9ASTR|nr:hypothetical protein L1987_54601 [Smallanthus sonchifolius]